MSVHRRLMMQKAMDDGIIDLSLQDIYGNPIRQTTANCYVISKVGTYKFPLVYGNALKEGASNPSAYTNNGGTNSHDFVNHNGEIITSPYIEDSVTDGVTGVQLSISDTDGVFTDISIIEGSPCKYVQFSAESIPDTGANGIISVMNPNGVIVWNWHIWVWSHDLTPVEITNQTGFKYNILPVNLATKLDTADSIDKTTGWKNWFYQFGRPTPLLCPSAYNSTSNHASYGALSYAVARAASDIQMGIKNPATFYEYYASYTNWFKTNSSKTYNLWDAACTSTGYRDNNVVKTIYDPCPIGFNMPNGNTFNYFSKSKVVGSFANGWKFQRYSGDTVGVFFPASGVLYGTSNSLSGVGSTAYVWLSAAYTQNRAHCLYFTSSLCIPLFDDIRADGSSVRPVQEQD